MKNEKHTVPTARLTSDSQVRLVAYTTAAGLGAFFSGQSVEAQSVLSGAFASYPTTLHLGAGAAGYNYINIDGNGNDFNLDVTSTRVTLGSIATGDNALNPHANGYIIPWTAGSTINATTGSLPTYKKWLATSAFDNFPTTKTMGFEFASGGQEYFGYMDIQIVTTGSALTSATITDIYYNATPNTGITIPSAVPEPSSLALLAVGVAGMAARRLRRTK